VATYNSPWDWYKAQTGGGVNYPDRILDLSASSETFAAGEGSYTIGGFSVEVSDLGNSAGLGTISLTNGVWSMAVGTNEGIGVRIDLGENMSDVDYILYALVTAFTKAASGGALSIQCSASTNFNPNWSDRAEWILADGAAKTSILARDLPSNGSYITVRAPTVTDLETTETMVALDSRSTQTRFSYVQGTGLAFPTDATALGSGNGANCGQDGAGSVVLQDRRYLFMRMNNAGAAATIELVCDAKRVVP
jgi:hypothetical protein